MGKILYVGGFDLPDRNAAAQRVLSIAKGLQEIGHEVVFLNYSEYTEESGRKTYSGFRCFEKPKRSLIKQLISIHDAKKIIVEQDVTSVIAYNYPAVALYRLLAFCRRKAVACYVDATEWYVAQGNIIFRFIKTIDTELRMRYLHFKSDGVIAISEYLYQYYHSKIKTVKIPPTVDMDEEKWRIQPIANQNGKVVLFMLVRLVNKKSVWI